MPLDLPDFTARLGYFTHCVRTAFVLRFRSRLGCAPVYRLPGLPHRCVRSADHLLRYRLRLPPHTRHGLIMRSVRLRCSRTVHTTRLIRLFCRLPGCVGFADCRSAHPQFIPTADCVTTFRTFCSSSPAVLGCWLVYARFSTAPILPHVLHCTSYVPHYALPVRAFAVTLRIAPYVTRFGLPFSLLYRLRIGLRDLDYRLVAFHCVLLHGCAPALRAPVAFTFPANVTVPCVPHLRLPDLPLVAFRDFGAYHARISSARYIAVV